MSETATDGGGWIACSERLPGKDGVTVEVRMKAHLRTNKEWWVYGEHTVTHWRPLPVDPHAVAACLFGEDRPTLAQARSAARHVAGCAECRSKLEAKGGA